MRRLLFVLGLLVPLTARADFLDDDTRQAAELGQKRHEIELRLVESWLRAMHFNEREIARHLAALTDDDLHRLVEAPQSFWGIRR